MTERDARFQESLIEQVCGSWRPRGRDGAVQGHPAWHDLAASEREAAYRATVGLRRLESALDRRGLTTTARSVLRRIGDAER